ncbi:MAG: hypothetical protein EB107_09540, partial [Proteobacteria bacterium]|nr:hypothetical protein [Pseudomonadota bacterium]
MVSGFQDYIFPLIRASIPQNPVLDWVSVQPMTRKQGSVFFQNIKYGNTKGRIAMGGRVFDALTGFAGGYNYSNEFVE